MFLHYFTRKSYIVVPKMLISFRREKLFDKDKWKYYKNHISSIKLFQFLPLMSSEVY